MTVCLPSSGARPMRPLALSAAVAALPAVLCAQELPALPSGQEVTLIERRVEDQGGETWLRFRYAAPRIARDGGDVDFATAAEDMDVLCSHLAATLPAENQPAGLIISLADRVTEFGASDPESTQFFEGYRLEDGICVPELF